MIHNYLKIALRKIQKLGLPINAELFIALRMQGSIL